MLEARTSISTIVNGSDSMLTTHDFSDTPLVLTITDQSEAAHMVSIHSRDHGAVVMICSCRHYAAEGWCRHLVDLACMRLRDCGITDPDIDARFEEIVAGTPLESAANDADHRLSIVRRHGEDVAQLLAAPETRDAMEALAKSARALAEATEAASDALRRFKRRAAGAID
jgi:hypothetical protein